MNHNLFAVVSLAAISASVALVTILHVLVREYNPIPRAMSNYVNSRYGWMMFAAFWGFATCQFALAAAFRQTPLSALQEIGVWLLTASAVCVVIAGIFPADKTSDDSITSRIGVIHAIGGQLLSPLVVGAMLCLSEMLESGMMILAIINAIAFVVLFTVNVLRLPIGGIGQRIFFALVSLWLVLASLHLILSH